LIIVGVKARERAANAYRVALRGRRTARALGREFAGAARICSGVGSFSRLGADVCLYRVLRLGKIPCKNAVRSIVVKSGADVAYRLNRGDIQSIREVLMDEAYRLPFSIPRPNVIVDLGANIGLTSLYLYSCFKPDILIAVEPDPSNAALARHNLEPLGGRVIEAAVGAVDGVGRFKSNPESNLGTLVEGTDGRSVDITSMNHLIESLPNHHIDLLKIDIEGGEQELLTRNTEWLSAVDAIIAEFHPDRVDYSGLIQGLIRKGFRYIPAGSAWYGSMDGFVRDV
jgi:FkbM family methyltransferase